VCRAADSQQQDSKRHRYFHLFPMR
jgi:hypothetical protein